MTFTNIRTLANHIMNHHISFGGEGGFGFLSDVRDILISIKTTLADPAVESINFEAWMDIPQYGELHTVITIGRDADGIWSYTECTYESALQMGII